MGCHGLLNELNVIGSQGLNILNGLFRCPGSIGINAQNGRDHYPRVFSAAVAGGGLKGGQVIGASSTDGTDVKSRPVTVPDLFCTLCQALKINPRKENIGPLERPIKIVDGGTAIKELF